MIEIKRKIEKNEKLIAQDTKYNKINENTGKLKIYEAIETVEYKIAYRNKSEQDIKNLEQEIKRLSNNDI